jgi:hypothetical protein
MSCDHCGRNPCIYPRCQEELERERPDTRLPKADIVRYEFMPSTHADFVIVQWECRTKDKVDRYRKEIPALVAIGAALDLMSKHHYNYYKGKA